MRLNRSALNRRCGVVAAAIGALIVSACGEEPASQDSDAAAQFAFVGLSQSAPEDAIPSPVTSEGGVAWEYGDDAVVVDGVLYEGAVRHEAHTGTWVAERATLLPEDWEIAPDLIDPPLVLGGSPMVCGPDDALLAGSTGPTLVVANGSEWTGCQSPGWMGRLQCQADGAPRWSYWRSEQCRG